MQILHRFAVSIQRYSEERSDPLVNGQITAGIMRKPSSSEAARLLSAHVLRHAEVGAESVNLAAMPHHRRQFWGAPFPATTGEVMRRLGCAHCSTGRAHLYLWSRL